jgi:hypothetical protein
LARRRMDIMRPGIRAARGHRIYSYRDNPLAGTQPGQARAVDLQHHAVSSFFARLQVTTCRCINLTVADAPQLGPRLWGLWPRAQALTAVSPCGQLAVSVWPLSPVGILPGYSTWSVPSFVRPSPPPVACVSAGANSNTESCFPAIGAGSFPAAFPNHHRARTELQSPAIHRRPQGTLTSQHKCSPTQCDSSPIRIHPRRQLEGQKPTLRCPFQGSTSYRLT